MKSTTIIIASLIALCGCTADDKQSLEGQVRGILQDGLTECSAQVGQVIVMETQTGNVLAKVGEEFDTPHKSSLVRCATLLAALETGKVQMTDTVNCENGVYIVHGRVLKDHSWRIGGYGTLQVKEAFTCNSSIGNYKMVSLAFADKQELNSKLQDLGYPATPILEYEGWAMATAEQSITFINDMLLYKLSASRENIDEVKSAFPTCTIDSTKVAMKHGVGQQLEDSTYWQEFCGYFPANNPQYTVLLAMQLGTNSARIGSVFEQIVKAIINNIER